MENTHSPQPQSGPRARREEQREQFRHRRVQALTSLLASRRELRGVSAVADHLDDAVRWSA